ncbi:MAG: cell envelope-related transcriptional attenuator [Halanaerobium sp.]|nr:MAG: cell envelope-related transcriptional attenuator [Halanaerobium sp.]
MAEKNTNDNQKSNKKHKWIGIFLIALLLLFIGLAGYYLERDLEPVPDNQIEDEEVIEEESGSPDVGPELQEEQDEEAATEERTEDSEQISDTEETAAEDGQEIEAGDEEDSEKIEKQDSGNAERAESDLEAVTEAEPSEDLSETETKTESDVEQGVEEEIEDPSLIDRILSILGLAESDFTQDLNILVVGLDDEESVAIGSIEADSIMLAKLRPEANKMQIEHIDEDTVYKGELLREYHDGDIQPAVEELSGTNVDYHVYINYLGFEKVIDELGGVQITLEQEVVVPGLGLNLKAGDNLLSGKEALNFVRWRDSDSIDRFKRQKLLINSVMTKLKSNNIFFNVKDLYNTIVESYNSIETDINPVLAAEIFNYLRESRELELEYIE